jgi:hypothetical protein
LQNGNARRPGCRTPELAELGGERMNIEAGTVDDPMREVFRSALDRRSSISPSRDPANAKLRATGGNVYEQ